MSNVTTSILVFSLADECMCLCKSMYRPTTSASVHVDSGYECIVSVPLKFHRNCFGCL